MADIGVFPASAEAYLAAPSVGIVLLAEFGFGDGEGGTLTRRFHAGHGDIVAGGYTWQGVSDPGQTRMVQVGAVELPKVQVAAKVEITLTGVDRTLLAQLRADVSVIYGAAAEIHFLIADYETGEPVLDPVLMFDNGICGMPTFTASIAGGVGVRTMIVPIDGIWANKNFAPGGRLNDAHQKARYPGDLGMELIGGPAYERIK